VLGYAAVSSVLAGALAGCGGSAEPAGSGQVIGSPQELFNHPRRFDGRTVTVTASVVGTVGPHAFVLSDRRAIEVSRKDTSTPACSGKFSCFGNSTDAYAKTQSMLVVYPGQATPRTHRFSTVTGVVHMSFQVRAVEQRTGTDLDDRAYRAYVGHSYLVASSVRR
jgi:hypothetical protein